MRHAYMIMAHDNFYNLERLLKLLDRPANDIYLHINDNVKDFDPGKWSPLVTRARLSFVDRVTVYPYTYTQVDAIVSLLKLATKEEHEYYHMLSGADLPIKSLQEIEAFFAAHVGQEFIGFSQYFPRDMVAQRHILQNYYRHKNLAVARSARMLNRVYLAVQKLLGVDRMHGYSGEIKKGWDWFSITHDAALHLLAEEPQFRLRFKGCYCPSEFFVQTILFNSRFKDSIYSFGHPSIATRRFIDWERGQPYVFRGEDFDSLMQSPLLFARKFIEAIDRQIIDAVYERVSRED